MAIVASRVHARSGGGGNTREKNRARSKNELRTSETPSVIGARETGTASGSMYPAVRCGGVGLAGARRC
ncbi:unnamed protein product, partial [Iphiclides podalirius]